ncbi:MAG TPA: hypothetical protein DCR24_10485 [Bacillus bacterium]|nr:hypothetical protein [Bacillus sp. (in: firmicutes)]
MGKCDFNALEIHPNEAPVLMMEELGKFEVEHQLANNYFCGYHTFRYEGKHFMHIGWNSANGVAYHTLKRFSKATNRKFFTRYNELYSLPLSDVRIIFNQNKDEDFLEPIWALEEEIKVNRIR